MFLRLWVCHLQAYIVSPSSRRTGKEGECKDCQKKAALRGANSKGMGINCLSCEPKNVPKWKKIFENFENMFAEGIASVDIAPRNNIVK